MNFRLQLTQRFRQMKIDSKTRPLMGKRRLQMPPTKENGFRMNDSQFHSFAMLL